MRHTGTISEWNDARGFGFITPSAGSDRVFLHISALTTETSGLPYRRRPRISEKVTYDLGFDERCRPRALDVRFEQSSPLPLAEERRRITQAAGPFSPFHPAVVFSSLFLVVLLVLALRGRVPLWIPLLYGLFSAATAMAYQSDKEKARRGEWRVSESTLHLMALLGGWPGALIAQYALRHKNRKEEFQAVFWAVILMNVALLIWLLAEADME